MVNVLESPVFRDQFVRGLAQSIWRGQETTENITEKIVILVTNRLWEQERVDSDSGESIPPFRSFIEFVTAPLERGGLKTSIDTLKKLCRGDVSALNAIDVAIQKKAGRPPEETLYIIQDNAPTGTKVEAALRRLRKDRPDLLERVESGELSASAAMNEAGFRPLRITIHLENPNSAAQTILDHMEREVIIDLIVLLERGLQS